MITFCVLLLIALLLYFLIPRIPVVNVGSYTNTSNAAQQSGSGSTYQLQMNGTILSFPSRYRADSCARYNSSECDKCKCI